MTPKEKNNVLLLCFKEKVLASDASVRLYTGMRSKKLLNGIFDIISKRVEVKYWRGPKRISELNKERESQGGKKCGPKSRLKQFEEYLMTLIHIKEGVQIRWLSDLFGLSESSVSNILITWISVLYGVFKNWLKYPSPDTVRRNLPYSYPEEYRDTRVILECAEFLTVKPANFSAHSATYSSYERDSTVKVLVGITPAGLITFVSDVYGGNTSDRHIAEKEFIHKVMPGDVIMADRSFDIADLLAARGAKQIMPPFSRKNTAGRKTPNEQAVERMKNYKILCRKIHKNTWPRFHHLLVIIAVMCNMAPPLFKDSLSTELQ